MDPAQLPYGNWARRVSGNFTGENFMHAGEAFLHPAAGDNKGQFVVQDAQGAKPNALFRQVRAPAMHPPSRPARAPDGAGTPRPPPRTAALTQHPPPVFPFSDPPS